MVAVNTAPWSTLDEWTAYWRSKGAADFTWATDSDQSVVRSFRVRSLGTTIIIDRHGRVSYRDGSATTYETLRAEIEKVL